MVSDFVLKKKAIFDRYMWLFGIVAFWLINDYTKTDNGFSNSNSNLMDFLSILMDKQLQTKKG